MCLDQGVLCDDSYKAGLASGSLDVMDDWVHEEVALQPRLDESGVHGPVQELPVEQDAVGKLHCGLTLNRLFGPENVD